MHNTFSKSINGHQLQFNRFLYPTRYTVKIDEFQGDGKQYEIKKDQDHWFLTQTQDLPECLSGITAEIHEAIEENEKAVTRLSMH